MPELRWSRGLRQHCRVHGGNRGIQDAAKPGQVIPKGGRREPGYPGRGQAGSGNSERGPGRHHPGRRLRPVPARRVIPLRYLSALFPLLPPFQSPYCR
jgi:hypothetical protein